MKKSFYDETGKRHYVRGKDEVECAVKIALLRQQIERGEIVSGGTVKVAVWAEKWLQTYKRPAVSASWYKDMESMINSRVLPYIGYMRIKDVKPLHVQAIMNDLEGLSLSYITKIYNIVADLFESAVNNQLIVKNPARGVALPKAKPAEERRALTEHEIALLLRVLPGHRGNLFCKLMLFCGLRPSEVAALRWSDIDIKKARLSVNKATKKDGTVGPPKSAAGVRVVPIPEILLQELAGVNHEPFALVCPQLNGSQATKTSIRKMWESVKRAMDLENGARLFNNEIVLSTQAEPLVLYDLRHTYCTRLQEAGVPIDVARRLMGHSSIEITSKIYTHGSESVINTAAELINAKNAPMSAPIGAPKIGTKREQIGTSTL